MISLQSGVDMSAWMRSHSANKKRRHHPNDEISRRLLREVFWNDQQTSWTRQENIICDSLSTAEGSLKHAEIGKRKRAGESGGGGRGRAQINIRVWSIRERGGCAPRVSSRANCNLHSRSKGIFFQRQQTFKRGLRRFWFCCWSWWQQMRIYGWPLGAKHIKFLRRANTMPSWIWHYGERFWMGWMDFATRTFCRQRCADARVHLLYAYSPKFATELQPSTWRCNFRRHSAHFSRQITQISIALGIVPIARQKNVFLNNYCSV